MLVSLLISFQFIMNLKLIILLTFCNIISTNAQFFNYITIKTYRFDTSMTILKADTINNEKNATEIIIEEEVVPVLKTRSFQNLTLLRKLFIQRTNLEVIEEYAFDNLPSLRIINFNFNRIKNITKNIFANLTVQKIYLKGNGISQLDSWSFYNLSDLDTLDLSSNNIVGLPAELFVLTPNLKKLDLSWNHLKSQLGIPTIHRFTYFEDPFENIDEHEDSLIDLSYNEIDHIDQSMFAGLRGVKKLVLNYNNITIIDSNALKFYYLEIIELEGNMLEQLERNVLNVFKMAQEINMANNPWSNSFVCNYKQWCIQNNKMNTIDIDGICTYSN